MNAIKITHPFFFNPMRHFGVRELSKVTNADTKTVMKYCQNLLKRKIIVKHKPRGKYPFYEANRLSFAYRHEKSEFLLSKIIGSGLIEFIKRETSAKAIVLFGSVHKGTYHKESDIDVFIQSDYKKVDLTKFERKIGHSIQLFFETNLHNLSKGLLTNIYNGLVLHGKLEVLL